MKDEQAIALSDASERLVYAYLSGDPRAVAIAKDEVRKAKEMASQEGPSADVVETLITNDPINAAAAGLLSFNELHERVAGDLATYLTKQEVEAVLREPINLRIVLAARMTGDDVETLTSDSSFSKEDFASAELGNQKADVALIRYLHAEINRLHQAQSSLSSSADVSADLDFFLFTLQARGSSELLVDRGGHGGRLQSSDVYTSDAAEGIITVTDLDATHKEVQLEDFAKLGTAWLHLVLESPTGSVEVDSDTQMIKRRGAVYDVTLPSPNTVISSIEVHYIPQ